MVKETVKLDRATISGRRNYQLDFLRCIFTFFTVLQHSCVIGTYGINATWVNAGNFAVEFFFMISGYFMAASWEKTANNYKNDNLINTINFMKHKISSIIFPYIVGFLVAMIVVPIPKIISKSVSVNDLIENVIRHIPEFFGIFGSGFTIYNINGNSASWYISCMLLSMLILYPILCRFKKRFLYIACPVIGILLLAYRCNQFEHFGTWTEWTILPVSTGLIRGIGGICFGGFIYILGQHLRFISFTKAGHIILAMAEICCWLVIFASIIFLKSFRTHYGIEVLMIPVTAVTLSGQSALSKLFNGKWWGILGKSMIYIYMAHWPIVLFMKEGYCTQNYWINTLILFILSIILAFVESLVCKLIKELLFKMKKTLIIST